MIENLIILIFDIGLLAIYILISFIVFMTIQLISYRIFKFNLCKWLIYNLIDKKL